jgi:K+-transporting ATPase ATPase C chain
MAVSLAGQRQPDPDRHGQDLLRTRRPTLPQAGLFLGSAFGNNAVPYDGASSAGSNLGPANPALKEDARKRIADLLAADPENRKPVPVDLVTASGSGLDPHISPAAAMYQVSRVAKARGIDREKVMALVRMNIRDRQFGILGEPTVHVLHLNMALDELH